jgi:hypothetical protein
MIEFRWIAFLTLWTALMGPIFDLAPTPPKAHQDRPKSSLSKERAASTLKTATAHVRPSARWIPVPSHVPPTPQRRMASSKTQGG